MFGLELQGDIDRVRNFEPNSMKRCRNWMCHCLRACRVRVNLLLFGKDWGRL